MKISHFILAAFSILIFLCLQACYEESNTGPDNYNNSDNLFEAKIEGALAMDFTTKSLNYKTYSAYTKLSATMVSGPFELYSIEMCFLDTADHCAFDLAKSDTLTNFKVYMGHLVKEYYFRNVKGHINFSVRNDDTVMGVFTFFAEDSLLQKSIIMKDGSFKFIKKKKV
jgi:hypothetical protein